MPHFLVFATDRLPHPPQAMPRREAARPAHRAYVLGRDGPIRLAGAMLDADGNQCGSVYSFEAASVAEVRAWLAAEPFVRAGVYAEVRIVEWSPRLNRLPAAEW